ncbi:hypothetical protein FGG08_005843 [Glutinoglossum americanum]|uniref:Clr5 domain-containing protein n=1 Tax=Glutinoglossum americanum TaxID=1670608 RepID=A0A9P8L117_9PEZI|nr:hypothetical protein FGG08_005843 [Glutinoglossum americanum]
MAREVQLIANIGAWIPQVPLQGPEQTETISDTAPLPPAQRDGDSVPRGAPDDEIANFWSFLTSPSVMVYGAGGRVPHMPDYNIREEDLSRIVDVTPDSQIPGMGQQAAFIPRNVDVAGPSPHEGPGLDAILTPALPLMLTQRTRRPRGPPLPDTNQCPEQEWEQMKPIIHRMYLEEGKTLDDVMSTLSLVYHFHASEKMYKSRFTKWGFAKYSKKGGSGRDDRHHATAPQRRRKRPLIARGPAKSLVRRRLHCPTAPVSLLESPDRYRRKELTVHCVQNYISALFQSKGWMADMFSISPPAGTADHSAGWRQVEDQCFGVSVLIQGSSIKHAFQTLDGVFQSLKPLAAASDPSIVVKFWPMCHRLHGICVSLDDRQLLYAFLRHFRELTKNYFGTKHPVFLLLNALSHVEWDAMISTLRVGYLKSIHCMESVIGADHTTVLSMWSNYIKYWDRQSLHQAVFAANFTRLLAAADAQFGEKSEKAISVLHGFTYAAFYNFDDQMLSRQLAEDLLGRTMELPHVNGEYQWGLESQSFAFASKVLALLCLREDQRDESRAYLADAISCLERGDRECKTRAVMLAEDLESWLKSWGDIHSAEALGQKRIRLLSILSDGK